MTEQLKQAESLRLADAIDPFTRTQAPDNLTMKVAADELRRLHALTTSQPAQAGEVLKCAMRHTPVWKSGVSGLPYQESNFACETCGYVGKHDMHPGCKKETQLAAQATPSSANRTLCDYFLNPNLSPVLSFDDDKQATPPQQAAGEPVGEHVATVAEVHMSRYTLEWNGKPYPEGTKLFTHPAPGVPDGWRMDREGDDAIVVQHPAVGIARAINPAMSMEGQVLFMLCDDILQDSQSLAAAQAKGGEHG